MFDSADLTRTAPSIVWLNDLVNAMDFEEKPVLMVLAKCDVPEGIRFNMFDWVEWHPPLGGRANEAEESN
jgi:hypothetical protein